MLELSEIFYSIQGESTWAGLPCTFIRLAGCNLRCSYCDTEYAYAPRARMDIPVLLKNVRAYECPLVEVTGGEPLLQDETPALITSLLQAGYTVLVETNGSLPRSRIAPEAHVIMDIKCPGSNESDSFFQENLKMLQPHDEIKFVLSGRDDYLWAAEFLRRSDFPGCAVHFSPAYGRLTPSLLASWILKDRLRIRLSLQLHKIIWEPGTPGV
ncbi:MAG: radical SAM protein [Desulfovibrionales bacterium]